MEIALKDEIICNPFFECFPRYKGDSSIKRRIRCSNQDSTKNRGIPACDIDFREASRGIAMHHRHRICHRAQPRGEGAIGT